MARERDFEEKGMTINEKGEGLRGQGEVPGDKAGDL
jgi:hypothetical protein